MFNNTALDVCIGLIFIFLLYSLLATILMEIIAHYLHLRPRLLIKALRRMLEDNPPEVFGRRQRWTFIDFFSDVKEYVKRYFYPFRNLYFLQRFYQHPTVKYLGESKSFSKPSYMGSRNFSQTIIQIFRGDDYTGSETQMAAIGRFLFTEAPRILAEYKTHEHWLVNYPELVKWLNDPDLTVEKLQQRLKVFRNNPLRYRARKKLIDDLLTEVEKMTLDEVREKLRTLQPAVERLAKKINADTLRHFQNIFIDAQHSLENFSQQLEIWFGETMERATGWYKRQTQTILLILGFTLAAWANVDSIRIYKILSKDKKAREQLVNLAVQADQKYATAVDTLRRRLRDTVIRNNDNSTDSIRLRTVVVTTGDSLLDRTYQTLQTDIESSASVLGLGWCSSDSCKQYRQRKDSLAAARKGLRGIKNPDATQRAALRRTDSLYRMVNAGFQRHQNERDGTSVLGWLITALAVSLGAPFWFDLLNKIVRLRSTGPREPNKGTEKESANSQPVIVQVKSTPGEEAVG